MPIDVGTMHVANLPVPDIKDDRILQYSYKQINQRDNSKRPPKLRSGYGNRISPSSSFSSSAHRISFRQDGSIEKDDLSLGWSYDQSLNETYFEQCFTSLAKIGEGSFGEVFKVRAKDDGLLYAVKMSKQFFRGEQYRQERLQEVRRYEEFSEHANCVRFYRAWEQDDRLYMQMELYRENLEKYLERVRDIPEEKIWSVLLDILLALESLHSRNLIHLDIKLENVLIGDDGTCKLGDFGLVVDINSISRACEGDSRYMAPEIMQGNFSKAADIFSLGIAILELSCCLELPSNGPLWQQLRKGILPEAFIKSKTTELQLIIKEMMTPDPAARPNVRQLLSHKKLALMLRRRNRWKMFKDMQLSMRKSRRFAWSKICKAQRIVRSFVSRIVSAFKAQKSIGLKANHSRMLKTRCNTKKCFVRTRITTSTPTPQDNRRSQSSIKLVGNKNDQSFLERTPPVFRENEIINSTPLLRKQHAFRSRKDLTKTSFDLLNQTDESISLMDLSFEQLHDVETDSNSSCMRKSSDFSSLHARQLFSDFDD